MKLYFDTSDRNKIIISLNKKYWEFVRNQKPQDLVGLIQQTLKKERISLRNIKEIEVNLGPGSFTGLKIGVSVANALGFALDIPVNGKRQLVLPTYEYG
jgi:tRNA threonylcarbamoyladenosine biosynthesis protein TsaB